MMKRPDLKPQEHIIYTDLGSEDDLVRASENPQSSVVPPSHARVDTTTGDRESDTADEYLLAAEAANADAMGLVNDVEAKLAKARERKRQWDALLEQLHRTRAKYLSDLANLATSHQDHEQALTQATEREHQAERALSQSRQRLAEAHARTHQWRELLHDAKNLHHSIQQQQKTPDRTSLIEHAQAAVQKSAAVVEKSKKDRQKGQSKLLKAQIALRRMGRLRRGVALHGFANYLQRAPKAQAAIIKQLVARAQERGRGRAGRRPASSNDPKSQKKHQRAVAKQQQRKMQAGKDPGATSRDRPAGNSSVMPAKALALPAHAVGTMESFTPLIRQHDQRLASLTPDMQVVYREHLDVSRQRGREAVLADVAFRQALGTPSVYQAPHGAMPLPDQARLIRLRGDGYEVELAAMAKGKSNLTEWILEPSRIRNARKGKKSRLRQAALHLVLAYPDLLAAAAASGAWDAALAYQLDAVLARLGLEGHRAAAFLHLDSASGHPHLHIVISRVRTSDYSLWSLAGRERTPALWLHGRSHTAMTFGEAALASDIDALGGWGDAAISGEMLMASNALTATRTPLDGKPISIPLQGPEAARRLHAVGHCPDRLGGGIWRYGLGPDPKAQKAWQQALGKAQKNGDQDQVRYLMAHRPPNRGGWGGDAMALEPQKFLAYLQRTTSGS